MIDVNIFVTYSEQSVELQFSSQRHLHLSGRGQVESTLHHQVDAVVVVQLGDRGHVLSLHRTGQPGFRQLALRSCVLQGATDDRQREQRFRCVFVIKRDDSSRSDVVILKPSLLSSLTSLNPD